MDEKQQFMKWIKLKEALHEKGRLPKIKDGEIWWCSVGKNIGVEINGKSDFFSRPVLVFKKLSRNCFMGISLTSQIHEGSWYVGFNFQGKRSIAVLVQARIMSVSRLHSRMGEIDELDFRKIKRGFRRLFLE